METPIWCSNSSNGQVQRSPPIIVLGEILIVMATSPAGGPNFGKSPMKG